MARYWVGGSGDWSDTNRWSDTSGGAGGFSVPTATDDVYFDGNSDVGAAFTVTINVTANVKDLIIGDGVTVTTLDQAMTLGGTSSINIFGSLFFPATNFTRSNTGAWGFSATTTVNITLNGKSVYNCNFNGVGGVWNMQDAFVTTGLFSSNANTFVNGTINTNNYNFTISNNGYFVLGFASFTFNAGSSTLSWQSFLNSGLTFNAGTSTLNLSADGFNQYGLLGGITYYNVVFTDNNATGYYIKSGCTFNNLTIPTRSASGISVLQADGNHTINGTLTIQSGNTDPTRRILFRSNTPGTQRTITAANIDFGSGIDFQDIVAAGAASPFNVSALQGGDCKNNSNITFPAAKTVYRRGTGNFSATQWASTSGGSPAADQFPLAQDTMVFDANTTTGTHTINASYQLGTLDMTNSTTVTLASGTTSPTFYGDITLSNAVTPSGTGAMSFSGRNTQTITSSGRTFTQPLTIDSLGGTVALSGALVSNLDMGLTRGTLDLNNQVATCRAFISNNSNTRSIAFGTGKIVATGNNRYVLTMNSAVGFSCTGIPLVELNYSGSVGIRNVDFGGSGGATEANSLTINITAGTDVFQPGGSASGFFAKNLNFSGFSGSLTPISAFNRPVTVYENLVFSSGMTIDSSTGSFNFVATTGTQQITTNGKTLDFPITKDGAGTLQLQDNLTIGSTRTFTHTAGTVDLNGNTLTVGTNYSTSNSNVRAIAFGSNGIIDCAGNFTATTGTNLTTSGTGAIKMSSASAKTFAGGGVIYTASLDQAGAGTLSIPGANTFADITNSNATASQITFPASTVTKVKAFTLAGTSGNLVSLRSSTPGTRFNLTYEP